MPEANVYNQKGEVLGKKKLPPSLFSCALSETLLHQTVLAQQANKRTAIAHTKDRSEVRGGGKKPWRQKGTGRARHGSIRSPIWRGGGVTFGPLRERNFSKLINKKMARKALAMALTDRARDGHIVLLDAITLPHYRTRELADTIAKLPNKKAKTLFLLSKEEKGIKRAADNLPNLFSYKADSVQALMVVRYPYLMMSKKGLAELSHTFGKEKEE